MKDEKKIKEFAEQIWKLESEGRYSEMEQYVRENNLSLEDLLEIDAYIQEKFLTK